MRIQAEGEGDRTRGGRSRPDCVDLASLLLAFVGGSGLLIHVLMRGRSIVVPNPARQNVFFYLYFEHENLFMGTLLLFGLISVLYRKAPARAVDPRRARLSPTGVAVVLSVCVLLLSRAGERLAMHDFGLSMDENAAEFQSKIFASGRLAARVPAAFVQDCNALAPVFVDCDPVLHTWKQGYLPAYAAIRSVFLRGHAEHWTNPFFAACSILLVAAVARRLWPGDDRKCVFAVIFLASSTQFLLTSMTQYSYPAHLCLNLLWLYLFLRRDSVGWGLLPWVGVLALGLHNPFVHALFVAPFLISMIRSEPRRRLVRVFGIYALGCAVWYGWTLWAQPLAGEQGLLSVFRFPTFGQLFVQAMNVTLIFSWQAPLAGLLVILGILSWRRLGPALRLLLAGVAADFFFYFLFRYDQQHGWGYRFVYGVLGNLILIAVGGLDMVPAHRRGSIPVLAASSLAITAFLQVPVRLVQAEGFLSQFSRSVERAQRIDADAVGVWRMSFWYAQDCIRNGPFLTNRPKFYLLDWLDAKRRSQLMSLPDRKFHLLRWTEVEALGGPARGKPIEDLWPFGSGH